jgi:HSF-type DNA-binding
MMEILSCQEYDDVLSWIPNGSAFIIYKKKKFLAEVLPKYFKQTKFTSFTRKLNRWGFIRIARGPEIGSYFHKLFHRDYPYLCLHMKCQNMLQSKQSEVSTQQNPDTHKSPSFPTPSPESMALKPLNLCNSVNPPLLPFGMRFPTTLIHGISNPVVEIQRKLQMEHILKQRIQQQKFENESIQRAMVSPYDITFTQPRVRERSLYDAIVNQNRSEFIVMQQMIAQSEASSMSAKPILDAIDNTILKMSPSVRDPNHTFPGFSL